MTADLAHAEGQARYRNGDLSGARACFEAALAQDAGHSSTHHDLGFLLRQLGESTGAARHVRTALAIAPDLAVGWTTAGLLDGDAGTFGSARRAIDRARLIVPTEPTSLIARADLAENDECPAFAAALDGALRRPGLSDRLRARLLHCLGRMLDRAGDVDRAFDAVTAAHALRRRVEAYDAAEDTAFFASIAQTCSAAWWLRPQNLRNDGARPVFIVGMPRSGTTLLEQMLSRHPALAAGGESLALQSILFRELPQRLGGEFPDCLGAATPADWAWAAERYLASTAERRGQSAVFTDKLPANFLLVGPILKMFPGARVLNLMRDPLDTCLSCYLTDFAHGHSYAATLDDLGHHYGLYRALMAHWHGLGDRRLLDVSYERLVLDPESTLRDVLDRCGLDWHPDCLNFTRSAHPANTAAWKRVRGPIDRGRVGNWRRYGHRLGRLAARLASPGGAPADLARRSLLWEPARPTDLMTVAATALTQGDRRGGAHHLARVRASAANDARTLSSAAGLADRAGLADPARGLLVAAVRAAPGVAAVWINLAVAEGRRGTVADAVAALRRSLALAPDVPEAWSNIGNFHTATSLDAAVRAHHRATMIAPGDPGLHGNRARALLRTAAGGPSAARALRRALALQPAIPGHELVLHHLIAAKGGATMAIANLDRLRCGWPLDGEVHYERGCALRDAGRDAEASAALRRAVMLAPEVTAWRHVLDSIETRASRAAPVDYVRELFDQYADRFDSHLTDGLRYRTPTALAGAISRTRPTARRFERVLDLGCGTGLMGAALRQRVALGHLTGVDVSGGMLAKLIEKGGYDAAVEADIDGFLERDQARYDLIVAADVLVYFGALERVLAGARRVLAPGGVMAVSVEQADGSAPYALGRQGRYAHRRDYVEVVAATAGLRVLSCQAAELRDEGRRPVIGLLFVLATESA